jgi:hypothetical protein
MLLKEEEKNIITGILGTVSVHLIILIVFLLARLDKVHHVHREPLIIEFDEQTYKTLEQLIKESSSKESNVKNLSQEAIKNIAVNTASQLENKISTDKYIEQLKEELNINELNQQHDRSLGNEPILQTEKSDETKPEEKKPSYYKGPTRISYFLEGRTDRYINIPVYKCQGSGSVVVNIIVNQEGQVISTSVASSNTTEECIINTALQSAGISLFNIDMNAPAKQSGTISYEFVAQ